MKHGKKFNHLGRKAAHRKSMLANMACSLIQYKRIRTTLAKAKEIRGFLEPLVTLAKDNTVANQRLAYSKLRSKEAVAKLFDELGPRYKDRPGGYLRVIKSGLRNGDKAPSAQIEFVDRLEEVEIDEVVEEVTS